MENNNEMQVLIDKMAKMEEELSLHRRVLPKNRLANATPHTDLGKSIKISLYREDEKSPEQVVTGWQMVKNDVRVEKSGVVEDQLMEIYLDTDGMGVFSKNELQGLKMRIGKLKNKVQKLEEKSELTDEEKELLEDTKMSLANDEASLKKVESGDLKESELLRYKDFFRLLRKEEVDVIGHPDTINGTTFYNVEFNGKKYSIEERFIN